MALFAVVLPLLVERHRHPRLVWLVPILTVAWASIHGSFFLAPLACGAAWLSDLSAGRPYRRTLGLTIASAVAPLLNPFGPAVYAYAIGLTTNSLVTDRIAEWQPTSPRTIPGLLFFGSALLAVVLLVRRGQFVRWPTLAWLGGLFLIGAYAVRGVAWWPIGAAVAVAPLLARSSDGSASPAPRPEPSIMRGLNVAIATAILVVGVILLPVWRSSDPVAGPSGVLVDAPAGLTKALLASARPGDHVFAPQPWGSWFELTAPEVKVFVDSRIELFPPVVLGSVRRRGHWFGQLAVDPGRHGHLDVVVSRDQGPDLPRRLA